MGMTTPPGSHADRIRDQFTKQAEPFAEFRIHSQEESLEWLREELRLTGQERILDAGCGPGLVACHLAPHAREVVGIDATPAMISKARERSVQLGCTNVSFIEGIMERLPVPTGAFDGVVTRYTFHHLLDVSAAMSELLRAGRADGRVVVCDAAPRPQCRDAYDTWERVRDPSHTSARTPEELTDLASHWLRDVTVRSFGLDTDVDALIACSFPEPGGRAWLRERMLADVGQNDLGMDARLVDGQLRMSFPILIVAGSIPA
jgi:ubiquinone/menaquinone biosynthesis C-methylase UbiE